LARDVCVIRLPHHRRTAAARAYRAARRFALGRPPLNDRFAGFDAEITRFVKGRSYRLSVIEHLWCAPYVELLDGPVVLDIHNVESALNRGLARSEPWPLQVVFRRFASACERVERRWLPQFEALLAASMPDAARLLALAPGSRVHVYPNAIPTVPEPDVAETDAIAFSGNLEYRPNQAAVRFFRREVWPLLREPWPGLVWRLIGKNPHAVRRYTRDDPRIEVTGPVDDAVAAIASARVAVVPLLSGSGTRLKILEAWAAARPVVSTALGAEGLEANDGEHLVIADTPAAFAKAVSRLLGDRCERARLGRAGRRLYEERYTWEHSWRVLHETLAPC
jgi:glycosyltransferase involved in cell wall biosynthesis